MPIYEYECGKCGCFEEMQRITEEPLKACPECQGEVHRILSASTSFALKGGGWYKDLYSSSGGASGTGPSKPEKAA